MADWSQLPTDLLQLISNKLKNNELYHLRFRSVCSTWRSSVPNYTLNNIHFPLKFISNHLIRHKIFLIKPPKTSSSSSNQPPWLIRIGPDFNGITHLWKPLDCQDDDDALPFHLPPGIDFNRFPVLELGHTFVLFNHIFKWLNPNKVVAATCDGEQPIDIVTYDSYEPKMFRFGGNSWTSIFNESFSNFVDICIFKGRPCVALPTGLTVMIRPDLSIHLLAEPLSDRFKFKTALVESEGLLLLVDRYSVDNGTETGNFRYNVFRLDEKEKKWVKLTTLGDRVLFLGDGCSFSASAEDLGFSNGNCVIFNRDDELKIFHLDQGRTSPLSDYPHYFKLFGPPPEWIVELHS